jgi:hypothetical protein
MSPAPEDAAAARRILLTGLAQDTALQDLIRELEHLHRRNNTFPGEIFLRLAADALAWCGASLADPLPLEGMRERFLPEFSGRGRDRRKLQYAVLAAAALHGGAEPDLLDEVARWQADDFCRRRVHSRHRPPDGRTGWRSMQGTGRTARTAAGLTDALPRNKPAAGCRLLLVPLVTARHPIAWSPSVLDRRVWIPIDSIGISGVSRA